jgi:hypothetical protein
MFNIAGVHSMGQSSELGVHDLAPDPSEALLQTSGHSLFHNYRLKELRRRFWDACKRFSQRRHGTIFSAFYTIFHTHIRELIACLCLIIFASVAALLGVLVRLCFVSLVL